MLETTRVGYVGSGRTEWLHLLVNEEPWNVAVTVPNSPRHASDPIRSRDLSPYEDFDVAVGTRFASVLTVTEGVVAPDIDSIASIVEAQLTGG